MRLILLIISLLIFNFDSFAVQQSKVDNLMNRNYEVFIDAFSELDAKRLTSIYHQDIIYIPEHRKKDFVEGSGHLEKLYQKFFNRVKLKNAKVSVGFRVKNRNITKEQITDVGYFLIRVFPASHTEQRVSEFAGKFLIIADRKSPNKVLWKTEMNSHGKTSHYFGLEQQKLLFFSKTKKLTKE